MSALLGLDLPERALAPDVPKGLGVMMAGGGDKTARRKNDFYPTPPEATAALLRVEGQAIASALGDDGAIWEPCGRGGAIISVLRAAGFPVVATDIVPDPAHDVTAQDLLLTTQALGPVGVTNPPFALAHPMIDHLLGTLGLRYLALLLKTTYWASNGRRGLLTRFPVTMRYDLTWRLDFTGGGSPTMECSWFVWDAARGPLMQWQPLPRDASAAGLFEGLDG